MGEFQEFTEALFGQLSVELDEEKEIIKLANRANEDIGRKVEFKDLEEIATSIFSDYKNKVEEFLGVKIPENIELKFPELTDLKRLKGKKVFADEESKEFVTQLFNAVAKEDKTRIAELMQQDTAKYLVYSTYAIQYISKITTTYGDYLDSKRKINLLFLQMENHLVQLVIDNILKVCLLFQYLMIKLYLLILHLFY